MAFLHIRQRPGHIEKLLRDVIDLATEKRLEFCDGTVDLP